MLAAFNINFHFNLELKCLFHGHLFINRCFLKVKIFHLKNCLCYIQFVWFAKLQIYTIAYIVLLQYFWYNNCQCFLIIKYDLNIHMKDVDYEYKYLKFLWSRSLFCWNIIKYLSLLHIEKEKKNIFVILKKKPQHGIVFLNSELTITTTATKCLKKTYRFIFINGSDSHCFGEIKMICLFN